MNSRNNRPVRRSARLLTALLFPALLAGFASVGQAQDITTVVVTAQRPVMADSESVIREQLREASANSAWLTRVDVRTDLAQKLGRPVRSYRIATTEYRSKRG